MVDRLTVRGALIAEELLLMIKPSETKPAIPSPVTPSGMRAVPQPAGILSGMPISDEPTQPPVGRKPTISPQPQ
jgi:hypothetical protein